MTDAFGEVFMKYFLVICLLFLANCASQTTTQLSNNSSNQNSSANQSSNSVNSYLESQRINKENVENLEIQNEKFKTIPEEFKDVNFKNYSYPSDSLKKQIKLKDGKYEYDEPKTMSGGWFDFGDVYFIDLTNDEKKEAIVLLDEVSCGGSCDGGSDLMYIYQINQQKPHLIWHYSFGSAGYGCGLKTLTIKEKKIIFDVFGRCDNKMRLSETKEEFSNSGKSSSFGYTDFIFGFNDQKFVQEKMVFHSVGKLNHLNYKPEISIND
jgi:hypothetical protein